MTDTSETTNSELRRRDFLRLAGLGAGALVSGGVLPDVAAAASPSTLPRSLASSRVVVVGAGVWGTSTALELARRGARVTLLDQYGPANSRATSGDETRGIRSSYGDRAASSEQWTAWARESIVRWRAFDAEHGPRFGSRFFVQTGDVIFRERPEPFTTRTAEVWDTLGVRYERVSPDEAKRRWPMINSEAYSVILHEPDAGVARARASVHALVALALDAGVELRIGRVTPGALRSGAMQDVRLDDGTVIGADAFVFACGPWLRKVFPDHLGERMRTPLGHVCYFGPPEGDTRFTAPNIPSWNVPGVTGWGALPVDSRGFRVRGAFAPPPPPQRDDEPDAPPPPRPAPDARAQDPDLSPRWSNEERIAGSRRVLERVFPAMAAAPLLETRSCHYESSTNRNFIVDKLPGATNAWVMGAGQAEGFKFAPLLGEYGAKRVLGEVTDTALDAAFAFPTTSYEPARSGEDDE
jgi:glycine/D-amino acid oxidase-like deaminating enzyme